MKDTAPTYRQAPKTTESAYMCVFNLVACFFSFGYLFPKNTYNGIYICNDIDAFLNYFSYFLRHREGGIPYTAHGAQITPLPSLFYDFCFYAYFRLG